ncbi:MAG: hypothetical protein ACRDBL_02040 [Rhabdaerophilum sp.]
MVSQVKSAPVALEMAQARLDMRKDQPAVEMKQAAKPEKVETARAVPSVSELNARAFLQRQQIGAALYDRSMTFGEGIRALKRQDAIASYAAQAEASGGLDAKEIATLERKLDRADKQITKLTNNGRGADLDSLAAIDGKELDTVQENLMNRINAGIKDGSLTQDEAKGLLARQDELNKVEAKLRESDGKLTGGEQKQMLDQLRKEADQLNRLRHNNNGVNLTYKSYSDQIDARQASLEKQIATGVKQGSLTEKEAEVVRAAFDKAAGFEEELRADGRVDWRDAVKMSTALNDVEISLYELQRNKQGVQLKEAYVDVKHVDLRQAQQLESLSRGISNRALTDDEGVELLESQRDIQQLENRLVKSGEGLDRAEFLKLQSAMNDFSLRNQELQSNRERYTGLFPQANAPVKPAPAVVPPSAPVAQPPKTETPVAPSVPVVAGPTPPAPVAPSAPAGEAPKATPVAPEPAKPAAPKAPEVAEEVKVAVGKRAEEFETFVPNFKSEVIKDKFAEMITNTIGYLNKRSLEITNDLSKVKEQRDETERNYGNDKRPPKVEAEDRVMTYDKVAKAVEVATEIVKKVA